MNKFSSRLPPAGTLADRYSWHASGIGDLSVYGQCWILDPKEHPFGNLNLGLGIKIPTGSWRVKAAIPDESGENRIGRYVWPPAIMPGDGGTGIIAGFEAFKTLRGLGFLRGQTLFASGSYLSNPRTTNGTPSVIRELGVPLTANFLNAVTNSVPDTYTVQAGVAIKVPGTWDKKRWRGTRFRVVGHWEGLPSRDLIGGNAGFRQPGYALAVGPGLTYAYGRDMWLVDVPIVFNRHINPGKTLLPGLPVQTAAGLAPGKFNPFRNLGLVAPVSLAVRYVRTF